MSSPIREANPPPLTQRLWKVGSLIYDKRALTLLFIWLLWGDFAWSMKDRSVGPVLQLLLKKHEVSDFLAGLLIGTLPGAVSMILGPIVSCKSDRHRGRWGRRIPFLFAPIPAAMLAIFGLACSPWVGERLHGVFGAHGMGLNAATVLVLALFWTVFEVATVIANSVFSGLINDVVPAAVIGRFYALFRALSLVAGIIFNFWIFGKAEQHFAAIFISIGLLYGGGFSIMCLKVKEGTYPPPPSAGAHIRSGLACGVSGYFKECFGHAYYLWFFAANAFGWMAITCINLFGVFFAKGVAMDMGYYGRLFALVFLISLVLSYPLGALADRFHPLRVSLAMMGLYVVATLWGGCCARDANSFALAMVAHSVLSGAWMTATASLGQRLLPKEKFAQYTSACSLVGSMACMTIGPVMGLILDNTGHVYRYTYLAGSLLSTLSLLAGLMLHRQFIKLGGPTHYTAP